MSAAASLPLFPNFFSATLGETDPEILPLLERGMRYVDEFAAPEEIRGGKKAEAA